MRKLRLLITDKCNRNCEGCCNKDWDLDVLDKVRDFSLYDEVYITGGEPMLCPDLLNEALCDIYSQNITAKVFLYTAKCCDDLLSFIYLLDGVTITLHEQKDVYAFQLLNNKLPDFIFNTKSLRLNIFQGVIIDAHTLAGWSVKDNITWEKNAPLPENEVFKRF